jgi:hypothetical protein
MSMDSPKVDDQDRSSPTLFSSVPNIIRPKLSTELQGLIDAFAERAVRLRDVLEVMQGRGYNMLLVLLAFPFCTPIPMPGVSTPFGLIIALVGLRLALGQKPWLPVSLLEKRLPDGFFPRLLSATRRLIIWLECFLKPRLTRIMRWRLTRQSIGMMIGVSGLLLLLPLPIPFSNLLPAMTVVLLASALIEDDGFIAVLGACFFLLTLTFFAGIGWGGAEGMDWLKDRFDEPEELPLH